MTALSRRSFIGGTAAGIVTATLVTVPGAHASPAGAVPAPDDDESLTSAGPIVARVRDVRTGEISLYVGVEEITHTDPALARQIARAAGAR